jgi:hypothetical protein
MCESQYFQLVEQAACPARPRMRSRLKLPRRAPISSLAIFSVAVISPRPLIHKEVSIFDFFRQRFSRRKNLLSRKRPGGEPASAATALLL